MLAVLEVGVAGVVLELSGVGEGVAEGVDAVEDDSAGSEEGAQRLGNGGGELLSEERHGDKLYIARECPRRIKVRGELM